MEAFDPWSDPFLLSFPTLEPRPPNGIIYDPVCYPGRPPFKQTETLEPVVTVDGREVKLHIKAEFGPGFFKVEGDWTCYRRTYLSITCGLVISASINDKLFLARPSKLPQTRVVAFAISVSASTCPPGPVKEILLVQHTPRRDKGPMSLLKRTSILPLTANSTGKASDQGQIVFDRIQFKQATANNGKRRAAQQYFNVSVDLWANLDDGNHKLEPWVKLASSVSDPLVIRGRSPGHYMDERWLPYDAFPPSETEQGHASSGAQKLPISWASQSGLDKDSTANSSSEIARITSDVRSNSRGTKQENLTDSIVQEIKHPLEIRFESTPDDNSSVSSASAVFSRSIKSSVSSLSIGLGEILDQYVNVLLEDPGLKNLCVDGFKRIDPDRFERNLRRLLKHYSIKLREEAANNLEVQAANFARSRSKQTANAFRRMMDPQIALRAHQMEVALNQEVDKHKVVERYLGQHNAPKASNEQQSIILVQSTDDHSTHSNSTISEDENVYEGMALPRSQHVKAFLLTSNAFDELREGLIDFVIPMQIAAQKPQASGINDSADVETLCSAIVNQCKYSNIAGQDHLISVILKFRELATYCRGSDAKTENYSKTNEFSWRWKIVKMQLRAISIELEHELIQQLQQRYQVKAYEMASVSTSTIIHEKVTAATPNRVSSNEVARLNRFPEITTASFSDCSSESNSILREPTALLKDLLAEIECSGIEFERGLNTSESSLISVERAALDVISSNLKPTDAKIESISLSSIGEGVLVVKAVASWLFTKWQELQRPCLQTGHRRIEWICECGSPLYADFDNSHPQAVSQLAEALQQYDCPTAPNKSLTDSTSLTNKQEIILQQESRTTNAASSSPSTTVVPSDADSSISGMDSGDSSEEGATMSRTGRTPDGSPDQNLQVSTALEPCPSLSRPKYLAICINTGGMYKTLAEIDASTSVSDVQLFHTIKQAYHKTRGYRARFAWLIKPVEIHFVHFSLWNLRHGYVSICDKPRCIPPKDATEYEYAPQPLVPLPPMPPEILLHYLDHGEKDLSLHSRTVWSPRLCKRLDTRIIDSGVPTYGWGIHIVEGPNRKAVFWIIMVTIFGSILSSILWSSLRNDVQGGTGLGTLIVAVPSAIMAAFLFKLDGV